MTEEQREKVQGHRKRVRDQVAERGLMDAPDYLVLEFLLFHAIPRKDTKDIANKLLKRFGNLQGVCDAPIEELTAETSMTYAAAVLLRSLPDVCVLYEREKLANRRIDTAEQVVPLVLAIAPKDRETLFIVSLDENNNFLCIVDAFYGKKTFVRFKPVELLGRALETRAKKIILVHNHPSGICSPSREDLATALQLNELFSAVGVEIIDQIIIASNGIYSLQNPDDTVKKEIARS